MEGVYVNGWCHVEEVERVDWSREEAHRIVAEKGGAFVFTENGEKKVM